MAPELRTYEMVYILRPDLDEEARRGKIARVHQLIQSESGTVQTTDEWGSRILAYEIQHFREGYYVALTFSLPPDRIRNLEDRLVMEDAILRHQIVRLDEE